MPTVYVTCGIAFSGKSTLAQRLVVQAGATLIRLDEINADRGFDGGTTADDREWEFTSFIALARLCDALAAGADAVVDDTFSHRFLRERFRRIAAVWKARFILLALRTPMHVIAARRAANALSRQRSPIDDDVFTRHVARFQWPQADEKAILLDNQCAIDAWLALEAARRMHRPAADGGARC